MIISLHNFRSRSFEWNFARILKHTEYYLSQIPHTNHVVFIWLPEHFDILTWTNTWMYFKIEPLLLARHNAKISQEVLNINNLTLFIAYKTLMRYAKRLPFDWLIDWLIFFDERKNNLRFFVEFEHRKGSHVGAEQLNYCETKITSLSWSHVVWNSFATKTNLRSSVFAIISLTAD